MLSSDEYGWHPLRSSKENSWIEVDLMENHLIEGIVTWGRGNDEFHQYIETFQIKHKTDGSDTWVDYTDADGSAQVST